jgi:hypothetical protein
MASVSIALSALNCLFFKRPRQTQHWLKEWQLFNSLSTGCITLRWDNYFSHSSHRWRSSRQLRQPRVYADLVYSAGVNADKWAHSRVDAVGNAKQPVS